MGIKSVTSGQENGPVVALAVFMQAGNVAAMSTKAQAILDEIRALPPQEFQAVWQQIQRWGSSRRAATATDDPIRSARGMFAGSRLTEALLASRAEDRRRG